MPRGVRAKASEDRSAPNGSIFGDSVAGAHFEVDGDPRISMEREEMISSRQGELEGVIRSHDSLIRELFHLEKFVSLTYFDPKVSQEDQSPVFLQWKERYDLLASTTSNTISSRHTRRAQTHRLSTLTHAQQSPIASSSKVTTDAVNGVQPRRSNAQAFIGANANAKISKTPKRVFWKGKQKESVSDTEAPTDVIEIAGPRRKRRKIFDENERTKEYSNVDSSPIHRHSPFKSPIATRAIDPTPPPSLPAKKRREKSYGNREGTDFIPYTPDSSSPSRTTITIPPRSPAKPPESLDQPSVGGKTVAGKTVAGKTISSTPQPLQSKPSIKRIKLFVREPPPLISRPDQRPPPNRFGKSLPAFLASYTWVDDREYDVDSREKKAVKEAKIRNKIASLKRDGRLALDAESALALRGIVDRDARTSSSAYRERERSTDVWATVVQSVVHHKHSKAWTGKQICSYIALKIRSYWENEASKEGKAKILEEKRLRALAKSTAKLVSNEWKKAVFYVREQDRLVVEAEQMRIGSQHLDAILSQSGQILEAQHLNLLQSGISRHRSGSGSISDEMSDEDTESASNESEVEEDEDARDDLSDESSGAGVDSSALLQWPGSQASEELEGLPGVEEEEEEARMLDYRREEEEEDEAGDEEDEEEGEEEGEEGEEEVELAPNDDDLGDDREEFMSESFFDRNSPHSDGELDDLPNGTMEIAQPFEPLPSMDDLLGDQIEDISLMTDEILDIAPTPTVGTNGYQTPVVDTPPLTNGFASQDSEPIDSSDKFSSLVNGTRVEPVSLDREPEPAPEPAKKLAELLAVPEKGLSTNDLCSPKGHGVSTRNETFDSGIDIAEPDDDIITAQAQDDGDVSSQAELPVSKPRRVNDLNEVKESIDQTDSPAPMVSAEERNDIKEVEAEDETWDVPEHLQPFAVARVNWRSEDKLKPPLLLRGNLRPYQQSGLEWLATLHNKEMNGILADEMGLGKTIQTISVLAHLACDRGIWGPHLIIVPTSVLLNWEMEFKKFLPGFNILSYHGTTKRRKELRQGWNSKYAFNVCVTSYSLASRDAHIFRRKAWYYMILDEAHMIKNFKSQRWNTLLLFKSVRRLLLTGTPLQNNLTELWALLKFLMSGTEFANLKEFGDWFSNPLEKAIEQGNVFDQEVQQRVSKLHTLLRPYLLRRLKRDVEKELPSKYEHLVLCRLSKRQRFLYDEFMARADTRADLNSGQYHRIANILMQLRKVCNHPDLFEVRPVVTSFAMPRAAIAGFEIQELLVRRRFLEDYDASSEVNLDALNLRFTPYADQPRHTYLSAVSLRENLATQALSLDVGEPPPYDTRTVTGFRRWTEYQQRVAERDRISHLSYVNGLRCARVPVVGLETIKTLRKLYRPPTSLTLNEVGYSGCRPLSAMVSSIEKRVLDMNPVVEKFAFATSPVVALDMPSITLGEVPESALQDYTFDFDSVLHHAAVKLQIAFPDSSLLQYDCGKLQELARLLRERHAGGHRVLIFTQMTKILDILEIFLNHHGYLYLRLDGATKIEDRQYITERFNVDERVFAFIASSRSGGVGINLTGADTVIFYDSDFNPQMDRQCEDRAHRIGQMRDVHIYRFISQYTVEEAMLRKANQKRHLDKIVIQQGEFDWRTFFGSDEEEPATSSALQKALVEFEDFEDAHAAKVAASEEAALQGEDQQDFQDLDQPVIHEGSITPTIEQPQPEVVEDGLDADNDPLDEPEDEEGGTVIEYMVSFVKSDRLYFSDWKL